ncbi:MAG: ATP-binding cassette domain-containing protein [Nitrospirae bacterium]|nr:ATP-binding cassette domain-containing protein [Nitrospirota bacterium]
MRIKKYIPQLISGAVLSLIPLAVGNQYLSHVFSIFYLYVIMAIGLTIVVSYAGLLDLGYVAFFAVGAYLYALLNTTFNLHFLMAIPLAAMSAAIFGVIIGFPTLRVRGDYLALVTLAFGEMIHTILINWTTVTNGPKGIYAIKSPNILGVQLSTPGRYYYVVFGCVVISVILLYRLSGSPVALIWESLRDDEVAAKASGVNPQKYYLMAFAIGASFAGLVGVLFASIQRFVSPESFVLDESILVLSIVVLSGGKSVLRIFIAATVFYLIPELLRGFKEYRLLIFGGFLVVFPIYEYRINSLVLLIKKRMGYFLEDLTHANTEVYDEYTNGNYCPSVVNGEKAFLRVHGVSKNYYGLMALKNISFDKLLSSNITALIGPNGAGKTTLFNCLSGIERFSEGSISFGAIDNTIKLPAFVLAANGIARTFQNVRLFRTMDVFQNILIGCFCGKKIPFWSALCGTKKYKTFMAECNRKADYYVNMLGLLPVRKDKVGNLPFGLQRKVEMARALAVEPKLLLLDEVVSGLNDAEKKEIAAILRRITKELGVSMLIVEHDMPFVLGLAEHVIVLDSGVIIAEGAPEEVSNNKKVIEAYLGEAYANG